jgi:hypothetical protein
MYASEGSRNEVSVRVLIPPRVPWDPESTAYAC